MDEGTPMDGATVMPARHKLDVGAHHALAEAGILGREDRVALALAPETIVTLDEAPGA